MVGIKRNTHLFCGGGGLQLFCEGGGLHFFVEEVVRMHYDRINGCLTNKGIHRRAMLVLHYTQKERGRN